ncbi:MAG: hypothetical protein UT24_C0018G0017 [Candidatus Woesebacteria bacterium GW2011_GWB1_39_12]|uniref:Uncharacterized protein n=1 Tax=Candidatus Woesebacteria bacterium GW2011_GWB1_39_12 TaxID=1618574 RepID=A0A0G0PPE0_9BACT|nr:MAG: hypothetical protein UT24_C0018G0017 [Candidatus Woesebacteria bacterium GW2011_GWB1_39_12]
MSNNEFQLDEDLEELIRNIENDKPIRISKISDAMKNMATAVREMAGIIRSLEEDVLRYEEELEGEE